MDTLEAVETRDFIRTQVDVTRSKVNSIDLTSLDGRVELINSMISLMVIPIEDYKAKGSRANPNKLFPQKVGSIIQDFQIEVINFLPVHWVDAKGAIHGDPGHWEIRKRTAYSLMSNFRNAFAHFNLRFLGKEKCIELFNTYCVTGAERCSSFKNFLSDNSVDTSGSIRCVSQKCVEYENFIVRISFESLRNLGVWLSTQYLSATDENSLLG